MFWFILKVGLTYLVVGFSAALLIFFVLKKQVPGNFIGALIIGLIGSFIGGLVYRLIPDVFDFLADFNDVNIYAAFIFSFFMIWILSKISSK